MMRHIIMVDIDDTLYDFKPVMAKTSERYGVDLKINTHDTWECLFQRFDDEAVFFRALADCFTPAMIANNRPFDDAAKVLAELGKDFDLWYVSDRPQAAKSGTRRWLTQHGFPTPQNLVCTDDKRGWMSENAHLLATIIDDRPRTMIYALTELDMPEVFALRKAWNSDLADVDHVTLAQTWNSLRPHLERFARKYSQVAS